MVNFPAVSVSVPARSRFPPIVTPAAGLLISVLLMVKSFRSVIFEGIEKSGRSAPLKTSVDVASAFKVEPGVSVMSPLKVRILAPTLNTAVELVRLNNPVTLASAFNSIVAPF